MAHQEGHYTGTPADLDRWGRRDRSGRRSRIVEKKEEKKQKPAQRRASTRPSLEKTGQAIVRRSPPEDLHPEITSRLTQGQLSSLSPGDIASLEQLMSSLSRPEDAWVEQSLQERGLDRYNLSRNRDDLNVPWHDEPIDFLEKIAETVPLGESLVPTTPRDIALETAILLMSGGAGNLAATGMKIPWAARSFAPKPFTFGPRVADKLAEMLPGKTAENLLEGKGLLSRIAQYIHPAKAISDPKIVRSLEESGRKSGLSKLKLRIKPLGTVLFDGRQPFDYRSSIENIPETLQDPFLSALRIAQQQARKMRTPGASPLQRRAGRSKLERLAREKREYSPVRRRTGRSRRSQETQADRDFLQSIGVRPD